MPVFRCLVNISGYCIDSAHRSPGPDNPTYSSPGGVRVLGIPSPTSCSLDPRICGFFITWKEECRRYAATNASSEPS